MYIVRLNLLFVLHVCVFVHSFKAKYEHSSSIN